MSFFRGLLLAGLVGGLCLAGFIGGGYWWVNDVSRAPAKRGASLKLSILPGMRTGEMATLFKTHGLIQSALVFRFWVAFYGIGSRLRPGAYEFRGDESIEGVIQALLEGREERVRVTIPEGWTLPMIANGVERAGICSASAFLIAASSPDLLAKVFAGWPVPPSAEGLAFPETYTFSRGVQPREIAEAMLQRTKDLVDRLIGREGRNGLSVYQACVLASLVEREGKKRDELPLIASVFLNRLKQGMRLESCATVQYVLPSHKERLTFDDLKIDSPFNTYLKAGLPPTPISNFGKAALAAVASPAQSDFLFFVSDASNGHRFATSLSEHERYRRQFFRDRKQAQNGLASQDGQAPSGPQTEPDQARKPEREKGRPAKGSDKKNRRR